MYECMLEVKEMALLQEIGGCRSLGKLKPLHLAEILGFLPVKTCRKNKTEN